jgi:Asp-tRNA(Asn)/Glu-tRNA(Gln) amidotransferase A subunit family amidase
MNRFDKVKDIAALTEYTPRHDPTVIPAALEGELLSLADLPAAEPRKNEQTYYTSGDLVKLYKAGTLTPVQVVEHLLPLIRRDISPKGSFSIGWVQARADLILEAAEASTARYKAGKPLSPLDGVPVTVKDQVDITGYDFWKGSPMNFKSPKDGTAWCVQKWAEAGAIILGKTVMHEIGMDTTNVNLTFGTPRNPHNAGYYTGGSSGGSAYAVASGVVPIALGADGGGSIRLPSSFCGIFGLKPSAGRVSARADTDPWNSVTTIGPHASSIDDLALAYRITAQPDPHSRANYAFPSPLVDGSKIYRREPKYLGIMPEWIERADKDVADLFREAVDYLVKAHEYEVVDIKIPLLPEAQKAHALTITNETRADLTDAQVSKLTYHNQLILGTLTGCATARDFLACQRMRSLQMSHLALLWEEHPGMLVLTPTCPFAGWKIVSESDLSGAGAFDGDTSLRSMEYVFLSNFTGTPSISVPMGYVEGGLPAGLMVCALALSAFA